MDDAAIARRWQHFVNLTGSNFINLTGSGFLRISIGPRSAIVEAEVLQRNDLPLILGEDFFKNLFT